MLHTESILLVYCVVKSERLKVQFRNVGNLGRIPALITGGQTIFEEKKKRRGREGEKRREDSHFKNEPSRRVIASDRIPASDQLCVIASWLVGQVSLAWRGVAWRDAAYTCTRIHLRPFPLYAPYTRIICVDLPLSGWEPDY